MKILGISISKAPNNRNRLETLKTDLVTMAEMSARLGISRVNAAALIRTGKLPGIKVANRWLVSRRDLDLFADTYVKGPGRPKLKPSEKSAVTLRQGLLAHYLTSLMRQLGWKRGSS